MLPKLTGFCRVYIHYTKPHNISPNISNIYPKYSSRINNNILMKIVLYWVSLLFVVLSTLNKLSKQRRYHELFVKTV
jgi:hypothetical protein